VDKADHPDTLFTMVGIYLSRSDGMCTEDNTHYLLAYIKTLKFGVLEGTKGVLRGKLVSQ
jgi:hypothetical protein